MGPRFTRMMLWLSAVCFLGLSAWIVVEAISPRETRNRGVSSTRPAADDEETIALRSRPALADFAPHLDRDLRAPLYDPPPVPPPTPEPKNPAAPPLTAKLLATMVEPGRSQAVLDVGGSTERVGVGDVVEQATVLQITPGTVILQRDGERITLTLLEQARATASQPGRRRP